MALRDTTSPRVSAQAAVGARIGFGEVRHHRLSPVSHAFTYPTCFLLLPMRTLRGSTDAPLPRNRRAMFGFRDTDHGDGRLDSLAWLEDVLAREGIHDADGEVWLHCIPRMYGLAFKPVSFWYAHRADGALAAIVVEVNNTFGERHCYLLGGAHLAFGRALRARKVFHVSPFFETRGDYVFRFLRTDLESAPGEGRTAVRVELHVDGAPLLITSVSGNIENLSAQAVRRALWQFPAMTALIVARIHWHALRLWLKRLAFVTKPPPPAVALSHGQRADRSESPAEPGRSSSGPPIPQPAASTRAGVAAPSAQNPA